MEIASVQEKLPECSPNLMPFHLSYSGLAPISTYFRVKPPPSKSLMATSTSLTAETSQMSISSSTTVVESQSTSADNALIQTQSSVGTLFAQNDHVMLEQGSLSVVQGTSGTESTLPNTHSGEQGGSKEDLGRFVASFRGRLMQGVNVDLPEGYGGLVLRSPNAAAGNTSATIIPIKTRGTKPRSKSRPGIGARATRRITRNAKDDIEPQDDNDIDDNADEIRGGKYTDEDNTITRILKPTEMFSSFVLWSPDNPVDAGKDEYLRSLTEWTRLAAEIHRYDE
ncbi:hypothetical protein SERLA73DRAFT_185310 [Serpula lacrymans var. lacrymans S7.3]|uniref:Uncharacterized protein n=2 Tax=Serpula lacrymans var. lacrymans TaxID=341189 RepID=F8Q4H5_SERL3|nr:uncharacterized protein SERLADRAFT_473695 [Serpula lacrymans var. lacrymans S7.9]EGN97030.1 hypothetical protein SERLA73DRAFT_185310 [Serpula lacrymans var. lacrymans S7.3]EGO22616.1 hypothetical protein SERLADRAFT_473695 [Serpula lacrymans var. lacrymans S7.9]